MIAALILGSCAIPIGLAGTLAWLHLSGDSHGMGTPQGMWIPLNKLFFSAIIISACLAILGTGRGRVLTLVALVAAVVSHTMAVRLQMD